MPSRKRFEALVPYYGCKRQAAGQIVPLLGEHAAYWEPFCGSCAVALAKPPCRAEVLNDLNGALVNLARAVASDDLAPALFERLSRTAFCEPLYRDSLDWLTGRQPEPGLDWAYHYFVSAWMGRNGLIGTAREHGNGFCKRHTSNGGDPATRFRNAVAALPAWWERMRNWTILCEDGLKLCRRIEDKPGTVVYVDPPYLDKRAKYRYDFDAHQHDELAEVLRRFRQTRCVVSYYLHPRLEELYVRHGWTMKPLTVPKNLSVQGGAEDAPEVVLINR